MCGEAPSGPSMTIPRLGPSPRVRGSLRPARPDLHVPRSIPACAGKPVRAHGLSARTWVHPRVCGEAYGDHEMAYEDEGPSPRVRGSPVNLNLDAPARGSIPACAGKPGLRTWMQSWPWVHPRVCGEADVQDLPRDESAGPSPRVRGSRCFSLTRSHSRGSIPACAGKPRSGRPSRRPIRVHPRVCGEARARPTARAGPEGPSPRVRGSPREERVVLRRMRSIPACAGKPQRSQSRNASARVHPRVCGEAPPSISAAATA